jgi:hypothetical protein
VHLNDILGIFGAIITLAIVATVLGSKNTVGIINAWMSGFATDIGTANGSAKVAS